MVQSVGMQQVLQYSNVPERVQHAIQGQTEDLTRAFNKEMEKAADTQLTQTHETKGVEEALIRDTDQRKPKHYARHLPAPKQEEEEKEEAPPAPPPAESGHGLNINVVA
ncbi:MAG: hypothetical protein HQK86_02930 [Nitrospinae bacterium]|nr:hypothetical protein [Nitrospinota bacterium]MBF0633727.1 hypothetical protein [Nitrospinota bacterium]